MIIVYVIQKLDFFRDSLQDFYGSKKSKQKNLNSLNRIRNSPSTSPRPGTSRPTPPGTPPHSPPNSSKLRFLFDVT